MIRIRPSSILHVLPSRSHRDPKPAVERRSPNIAARISTTTDKQPRILKPSGLQSQLTAVQEELKAAKERLASVEKEKIQVLEELKRMRKDWQTRQMRSSKRLLWIRRELKRLQILRSSGPSNWSKQTSMLHRRRKRNGRRSWRASKTQAVNATELRPSNQELNRVKHKLAKAIDAKKSAMSHADDATNIAEINAEKVELLSWEVSRLKSLLESELEKKNPTKLRSLLRSWRLRFCC